jgi:hypothetical protein
MKFNTMRVTSAHKELNEQAKATLRHILSDKSLISRLDKVESLGAERCVMPEPTSHAGWIETVIPGKVLRIVAAHLNGITSTPDIPPQEADSLKSKIVDALFYIAKYAEYDSIDDVSFGTRAKSKVVASRLRTIARGEPSALCASELRGLADTIEAAIIPRQPAAQETQ